MSVLTAPIARFAAFALLCLLAMAAQAQLLDDLDVRRDGAEAVLRIRFSVQIQYQRHAPTGEADLVQVYFRITGGEEEAGRVIEEQRRHPASELLPAVSVLYPPQPQAQQRRIDIQFGSKVRFRIRPGEDNRSLLVIVPLSDEQIAQLAPPRPRVDPATLPPSSPPSATAPAAATDVDRQAEELNRESRAALAAGDAERAIMTLNRLLNLPPNAFSQEAQELIGIARELAGETTKARAEFELYLKLYPDGPGADRVRSRLATLAQPPRPGDRPAAQRTRPTWLSWGSVSAYYYGGQSRTDTTTTIITPATNATTIDTASLATTDQSQMVANVDANARFRDGVWDNRFVFRDSYTQNFLSGQSNRNRLTAFFAEAKNAQDRWYLRIGRQTGISGGILGRFDGAVGGYAFTPVWKANVYAGEPVESLPGSTRRFYGASVDAENVFPGWSGSVYAIEQRTDSYTDRRALGSEIRYFDPERSAFALLDYDVDFRAVNIAMLQATWQRPGGAILNLLYDFRKTPTLQLANALVAEPGLTLADFIRARSTADARDQARALTPTSKVLLLGLTYPLNTVWQVGGDVRVSSLTGTGETPTLPASPGTGNVYTYTVQTIATNLFGWREISVVNGSYLTGPTLDAWSLFLNHRVPIGERWTIEPSLRYYRQSGNTDARLWRVSPGLRLTYKWLERLVLEAEIQIDRSHSTSALVTEDATRRFYLIGFRYDFQ